MRGTRRVNRYWSRLGGEGNGVSAYRHISVLAGGERRIGVSAHRRVSVVRGGGERRIGVSAYKRAIWAGNGVSVYRRMGTSAC